jgi:hypothetical protein
MADSALQKANVGMLHNWPVDVDDAKREIFEAVGDLGGIFVAGTQVLLGAYLRPSIRRTGTAGREIIIPGSTIMEDQFQGKVALILKFGAAALPADDDPYRATFLRNWGGKMPKIGDWVYTDVKQVFMFSLLGAGAKIREDRKKAGDWTERGWPARFIFIKDVYGTTQDPNAIV